MRKALPRGMHLAPFLSASGRPVLLVTDEGGRLLGMAEARLQERETIYEGDQSGGHYFTLAPAVATSPAGLRNQMTNPMPYGVHLAPWRPAHVWNGRTLLAIDEDSRMRAYMDVPDDDHAEAIARADLRTILSALPEASNRRSVN